MSSSKPPKAPGEALELLQQVVDHLPQFIFWKDRDSVYQGCNARFAKVAGGGKPEDIVGKTDFELAWKREEAEWFRKVDRRVMDSGVAEFHILEPQKQSDGKEAWLDTNKIPLVNEAGEVIGILGTFEDVSLRKAQEEQAHHKLRLESIGKLAGGIAHDFNNLLGGIIGAGELLQRRASSDIDRDLLAEVLRTSERAADLTKKLLAFSRRGNMREEVLCVHEAIGNVLPLLQRGLDPRIVFDVELNSPRHHVRGDVSEIELALLNLGFNARDAMPEGGTLKIATEQLEMSAQECDASRFNVRPGAYVRISVEDSGTGVPPEVREHIFEPFFTTKGSGSGTGLGLSAVYGAVQSHLGAIQLDSTTRRGARFVVDLPVCEASKDKPTNPSVAAFPVGLRGTVLLADDEPLIRRATAERLRRLGFSVLTASSGEDAFQMFQDNPEAVALVLLDIVMPRMGGVECCQLIQQLRPNVPMILSSGFPRDQLIGAADGTTGVVFLKKPYDNGTLARAVEEALGWGADGQTRDTTEE